MLDRESVHKLHIFNSNKKWFLLVAISNLLSEKDQRIQIRTMSVAVLSVFNPIAFNMQVLNTVMDSWRECQLKC